MSTGAEAREVIGRTEGVENSREEGRSAEVVEAVEERVG